MPPLFSRPTTVVAGLAGFAVLGVLAGCSSSAMGDATTSTSDAGATTDASVSETAATTDATSSYADGTYEATGSYVSPGGKQQIDVTLTLSDDIVTAVDVTPLATTGNSVQYQKQFQSGIAAVVVGKNIDELDVSRVSGSSLTSQGFNDAVEQIKADAAS